MPIYHLNHHAEAASFVDEEGLALSCLGDALQFVYDLVQELRAKDPLHAHWRGCRFEVADESGVGMLTVPVVLVMGVIRRQRLH